VSHFRKNFGSLLSEIETAVRARNASADAVAGPQVLRPAALRFEEQPPELSLGEQLYDPTDRRRRDT
jgi:hypothetical protein